MQARGRRQNTNQHPTIKERVSVLPQGGEINGKSESAKQIANTISNYIIEEDFFMTENNNQEEKIWQEAYDKAATEIYEAEYQRLIDDGVEEKEARYIARDNADFRAKDIAYSEVSDYRRNYKYFKE